MASTSENPGRPESRDAPASLAPSERTIPPTSNSARNPQAEPSKTPDTTSDTVEQLARLQTQLDQLRAGLSHAHRLTTLGTMAAIVAHEYNNILTPIISYAQLALAQENTTSEAAGSTGDDTELTRKALRKILQGAERASQISSSLLGFAREATGQTTAPLRQTIDDALACLVRDPARDAIRVHIDVPDVTVAMAPVSLQQVLLNLMLNAVKAMRPRGGRLVISAHTDDLTLTLDVADTGPGIPAHIRKTLFEPFVTSGNPGNPQGANDAQTSTMPNPNSGDGGTGLGLCVCRELIEAAGGRITFETAEGEGTTFRIALPLVVAAEQPNTESNRNRAAA